MSKVSLGKVTEIREKGLENAPLFLKNDKHDLTLLGQGTWGKKASKCVITSKGTIGAFALMDCMEKDGILSQFTVDEEFVFETGTRLFITISEKNVVQVEIPTNSVTKKRFSSFQELQASGQNISNFTQVGTEFVEN